MFSLQESGGLQPQREVGFQQHLLGAPQKPRLHQHGIHPEPVVVDRCFAHHIFITFDKIFITREEQGVTYCLHTRMQKETLRSSAYVEFLSRFRSAAQHKVNLHRKLPEEWMETLLCRSFLQLLLLQSSSPDLKDEVIEAFRENSS